MTEHQLGGGARASGINEQTAMEPLGETHVGAVVIHVHIFRVTELVVCGCGVGLDRGEYPAVAGDHECHPLAVATQAHVDGKFLVEGDRNHKGEVSGDDGTVETGEEEVGGIGVHVRTEYELPFGIQRSKEGKETDPRSTDGEEGDTDHGSVLECGMGRLVEGPAQGEDVEQDKDVAYGPAGDVPK
jgi:hypothetical protein